MLRRLQISQTKYDQFHDIVSKVAGFVAKAFPEIEPEDLFQELMLWVLSTKEVLDPNDKWISNVLRRRANAISWEYRKQSLYISAQYSYRTVDVKRILRESMAGDSDDPDTVNLPGDFSIGSPTSKSDIIDKIVLVADVKAALKWLPDSHYDAIVEAFYYGNYPTDGNGKKVLARAIERLTDNMNTYKNLHGKDHKGPGARRAKSTQKNKEQISNDWNG